MQIAPLTIEGAWLFAPRQHRDERGAFLEWFKGDRFAEVVGHSLEVAQSNISTSLAGAVRGIHYADVPPGQAKYVTCVSGAVMDVVVDLRVGSPTFGQHELVRLDDQNRSAVYLSEGLGHGYMALTDGGPSSSTCARRRTRPSASTVSTPVIGGSPLRGQAPGLTDPPSSRCSRTRTGRHPASIRPWPMTCSRTTSTSGPVGAPSLADVSRAGWAPRLPNLADPSISGLPGAAVLGVTGRARMRPCLRRSQQP